MKGRPILVEFRGEPMSLREVGRLIGVSARAMANRYEAGKRGAELFAPADKRKRKRGRWGINEKPWVLHPREWNSWTSMITRCTNPLTKDYGYYGGRGIKVCERWKDFANFLADMGERPYGKTLDRYPDNNGNYEPGNCRWATWDQQGNNRRPRKKVSDIASKSPLCDMAIWR